MIRRKNPFSGSAGSCTEYTTHPRLCVKPCNATAWIRAKQPSRTRRRRRRAGRPRCPRTIIRKLDPPHRRYQFPPIPVNPQTVTSGAAFPKRKPINPYCVPPVPGPLVPCGLPFTWTSAWELEQLREVLPLISEVGKCYGMVVPVVNHSLNGSLWFTTVRSAPPSCSLNKHRTCLAINYYITTDSFHYYTFCSSKTRYVFL